MRGVSAISDYLESARKGQREAGGGGWVGGSDSEKGGECREGRRGRKNEL